jgi:PleD family two-component response regulator
MSLRTSAGSENAVGRRVLIADDNHDAAVSLSLLLQAMGHETRIAHDGLEAVQTAEDFRPEVVLLDIGMPKLDGYERPPGGLRNARGPIRSGSSRQRP